MTHNAFVDQHVCCCACFSNAFADKLGPRTLSAQEEWRTLIQDDPSKLQQTPMMEANLKKKKRVGICFTFTSTVGAANFNWLTGVELATGITARIMSGDKFDGNNA